MPSATISNLSPQIYAFAAQASYPAGIATLQRPSPNYSGAGSIIDTTIVQTGPSTIVSLAGCRVALFDYASLGLVGTTTSDASGAFTFPGINSGRQYFTVAFDPSSTYDAVATQNLQVTP